MKRQKKKPELLNILREDDAVIVINKPAGYTLVPGRGENRVPLRDAITEHIGAKSLLVHRLDRDTSGVCVLAKTKDAQRALSKQFADHTVEEEYHALVIGEVQANVATIEGAIGPDRRRPKFMAVNGRAAKEAVTDIRVLERFHGNTLVAAFPRTDRTHQIRVHLSHIGHPCLVDRSYGGRGKLLLSEMKESYKLKPGRIERPLIERITLHAASITFKHPASGEEITITADYPKDFTLAIKMMRRWRGEESTG